MISEKTKELLKLHDLFVVPERDIYNGETTYSIIKVENGMGETVFRFKLDDEQQIRWGAEYAIEQYLLGNSFGPNNPKKSDELKDYVIGRLKEDYIVQDTNTLDINSPINDTQIHLQKVRFSFQRYEQDFRRIYELFIKALTDKFDVPKYAYLFDGPDLPFLDFDYPYSSGSEAIITIYIECKKKNS